MVYNGLSLALDRVKTMDKELDLVKKTKKLQLDIPYDLHLRFKTAVAMNETSMIAVLQPYIEQWVKEHGLPEKK